MAMHAHITVESADCDGRYSLAYVYRGPIERGTSDFVSRVMYHVLGHFQAGTAKFTEDGFTFRKNTDEGYVHTEVTWCWNDDLDASETTYRDHSAEAAGY